MAEPPSLGIWGQFDVDDTVRLVELAVARHELRRRIPGATLRVLAPFGTRPDLAANSLTPIEAIVPASPARAQALCAQLNAVVSIGPIETDRYEHRDVAAADAAVAMMETLDGPSLHRSPSGLVDLAPRVWDTERCAQRQEFLRAMLWWPQSGAAEVFDAATTDIAASTCVNPNAARVFIHASETSRDAGDGVTHRIPRSQSSVDDRVTAIAGASVLHTADPELATLAQAFGVAVHGVESEPRPSSESTDTWLDSICIDLETNPRDLATDAEVTALRKALLDHEHRLAHERLIFADYVRAVRNVTAAEIERITAQRSIVRVIASRLRGTRR